MVLFNGLLSSEQAFSSDQGVVDLNDLHKELTGLSGGVSHDPDFGGGGTNGEIFSPGVYDSTGAITITGTITLDGNSETNPVFVFRGPGALTTTVNTEIRLINGATANNVFWITTGTISTGANTIMKGTLFSNAAIALGADTTIEGRMFSKTAALSMGTNSIVSSPSGDTDVGLGVLSSFVMFTAAGAISGSCSGCITGDVGTASGATSAFDGINGTVYGPGTEASDPGVTTYGIYQNGVEVANSSRVAYTLRSVVSLQALVSVTIGNSPIEVRWKVDKGEAKLLSRTLSLIRSHY
jgi:hypothetical protein